MNWRDRLNQFMNGRYGTDQFSRFLLTVGLILLVLGLFIRVPGLSFLVLLILAYVYFRMFSRNIQARYAENQKYLEYKERFLNFIGRKGPAGSTATHHIFRCPKCGQKIRVPRGKGMIEITCPKCRTIFRKRS